MRQLAQSGLGILLVTHHVSEIIPEIERIILLKNGRVAADGTKRTMLTAGRLSELFGVELRVITDNGYYDIS
jgi:iron complex transport system ATP-binding protein